MFYIVLTEAREKPAKYGRKGSYHKNMPRSHRIAHVASEPEEAIQHLERKSDQIFMLPDEDRWLLSEPAHLTLLYRIHQMREQGLFLSADHL